MSGSTTAYPAHRECFEPVVTAEEDGAQQCRADSDRPDSAGLTACRSYRATAAIASPANPRSSATQLRRYGQLLSVSARSARFMVRKVSSWASVKKPPVRIARVPACRASGAATATMSGWSRRSSAQGCMSHRRVDRVHAAGVISSRGWRAAPESGGRPPAEFRRPRTRPGSRARPSATRRRRPARGCWFRSRPRRRGRSG